MGELLERTVHFVGTYPGINDVDAMRQMADLAGPYLESMPTGETDKPDWIASREGYDGGQDADLEVLKHIPGVRMRGPDERPVRNDYLGNIQRFAVTDRKAFFGTEALKNAYESIYVDPLRAAWGTFTDIREHLERPDLRLQIGIPGSLQPSIFMARTNSTTETLVKGLVLYRKPFTEAYQHVVDTIHTDPNIGVPNQDNTGDLTYHIELPAESAGMNKMWRFVQGATNRPLGEILAHGVAQQVAGLPEGANVVIHTCNGDWEHRAYSKPSTELLVALGRSIVRQWPTGRTLSGLHIPLGSGDNPPPVKAAHYKALGKLADDLKAMPQADGSKRPSEVRAPRLIAGFIHEDNDDRKQAVIKDMIQQATGEEVKHVAAACGLGRINSKKARLVVRKMIEAVAA